MQTKFKLILIEERNRIFLENTSTMSFNTIPFPLKQVLRFATILAAMRPLFK